MKKVQLGDFIELLQEISNKRGSGVSVVVEDSDGEVYSPTLEYVPGRRHELHGGRLIVHGYVDDTELEDIFEELVEDE